MSVFKKRERFDRSDVPVQGPYTNVIGAVVCLVVLAATALVVFNVWNRVKLESRLGDPDLSDAVGTQASVAATGGYAFSTDDVDAVLILTADSADEGAGLAKAQILAVNNTQGTAALATVPGEAALTVGENTVTLADLFASEGADACVAPLSAAVQLRFGHVVVATEDVLEEAAGLAKLSARELLGQASGFLSKVKTDMDAEDLLALAKTLSGVGVANLTQVDAALVPQTVTDAEGNEVETGYQVVDRGQLGSALGVLVAVG